MKRIAISLLLAACAPAAGPGPVAPAPAPHDVTINGILDGGVMGIGGETTGWELEAEDGQKLDVDVHAIADAQPFSGKNVTITGEMTTKKWVERGVQKLLVAHTIVDAK